MAHRVTSDAPAVSLNVKSGAPEGPTAAFIADFQKGTAVHQPRGTWDMSG